MKKLIILHDKDVGFEEKKVTYKERRASRGIVRYNNKIALMHVQKKKYFKLPGGGLEGKETPQEAFHREIKEEVGATITNLKKFGETEEFRSKTKYHQISHCFIADVIKLGKSSFDDGELEKEFKLIWCSLDEAFKKIKESKPMGYTGKFVVKRDLRILEEYIKIKN